MTNAYRVILPPSHSFTAKATAVVSGGYLLKWTSGTDSVTTSGASSLAFGDVCVARTDAMQNCVGLAMNEAASGAEVGVALNGVFVLQAGSVAVSGGWPIVPSGYGDMVELTATAGSVAPIGRALSTATLLTGYAVCYLRV